MNTAVKKGLSENLQTDYILETSSGTISLVIALTSYDFGQRNEVIIPSVTCPAVLSAVQLSGLKPVFVDMELTFFNMNIEKLEKQITKKTAAVIGVHCFGITFDVINLKTICDENNLLLIEDCCLTFGNVFENHIVGTIGDISVFSFGYDKLVTGAGGAMVFNNKDDFSRSKKIIEQNQFFQPIEYNNNLVEKQFSELESNIFLRNQNAKKIYELLDNEKIKKPTYRDSDIYWRYPLVFLGDRKKLISTAKENKLIITSHYPALSKFQHDSNLEVAQLLDSSIINLFVNKSADSDYLEKTVELINNG